MLLVLALAATTPLPAAAQEEPPNEQPEPEPEPEPEPSIFTELAVDPYIERYGRPPDHGWIRVFETPMEIRVGGFVQLNVIHDFQDAGYRFGWFIPALIATPTADIPNTELDPRPSRFTFETRTEVPDWGTVSTFLSFDWFGAGAGAATPLPRLRQVYVTWVGPKSQVAFTVGQAWTTFVDLQVWPDLFDLEGPNAMTGLRQGVIRASYAFGDAQNLIVDVSIEQPQTAVQNGIGRRTWPDLAARVRWQDDWGHLQLAGVARALVGESLAGTGRDTDFGNGLSFSGSLGIPGTRRDTGSDDQGVLQDAVQYQVQGGRGTGRYVFDLGSATSPQDAYYDDATANLVPLWQVGAFLSYRHYWSDFLRSTAVGSFEQVYVKPQQADDTYHRAVYAAGNLIWRSFPGMDVGIEYNFGRLWTKDGTTGYAHRLLVGANYGF